MVSSVTKCLYATCWYSDNALLLTQHQGSASEATLVTLVIGVARGCSGCTCIPTAVKFFSGLIYRKNV